MIKINSCNFCNGDKYTKINYLNKNICFDCYMNEKKELFEYHARIPPINPQIDNIFSSVYLGNLDGSKLKDLLKEVNVTHILNCSKHSACIFPNNFDYLELNIDDMKEDEDITKYFEISFRFIKNSKTTFIYCLSGDNVSPAILIGFLMWVNKLSYDEAFKIIKEKRESVFPYESFIKQLKNFNFGKLEIK